MARATNLLGNAGANYTAGANSLGNAQGTLTGAGADVAQANNLLGTGANGAAGEMQALQATPGYQFTLDQGLESTQNGASARGLGTSGAADKAAASYATGLASTTYQNQLGNALSAANTGTQLGSAQGSVGTQQAGIGNDYAQAAEAAGMLGSGYTSAAGASGGIASNYLNATGEAGNLGTDYNTLGNSLYGNAYNLSSLGESAAAGTGQAALTTGQNVGNAYTSAGNALAAGTTAAGSAASTGLSSLGSSPMQYMLYQNLLGGGSGNNPFAGSGTYV